MKRSRKGQAAFEYLVTYGWAFLVIITAVGVLSYFGFLSPQRYIPNTCEFGEQFKCVDYVISDQTDGGVASGHIVLRMRNNFEVAIEVTDVHSADLPVVDSVLSLRGAAVVLDPGEIKRVEIAIANTETVLPKDKLRYPVTLTFNRESGSVQHNLSGVVFAEVANSAEIGNILS